MDEKKASFIDEVAEVSAVICSTHRAYTAQVALAVAVGAVAVAISRGATELSSALQEKCKCQCTDV